LRAPDSGQTKKGGSRSFVRQFDLEPMEFSHIFAGFAVGYIIGLTGVGGGSLMTPLLILGFGVKPIVAVGTDLLYAAVTKSGGVWIHHRLGNIRWRIVLLAASGSVPGSLLAVLAIKHLYVHGGDYEPVITFALGLALLLTALVILCKDRLQRIGRDRPPPSALRVLQGDRGGAAATATVFGGFFLGILVTLSSIGAGALGTAALMLLYPRLKGTHVVGTDLAHAVPITAIAGLGHLYLGTVDWVLLGSLLAGSLPGIFLGSHSGPLLPEKAIRMLLAGMMILVGLRVVL